MSKLLPPTLIDARAEKALRHIQNFVPHVFPTYRKPKHLEPLTTLIEDAFHKRIEPLRHVIATPPRHGKTETLLFGAVWMMMQRPNFRVVYVTHSQDLAQEKSLLAQRIAIEAGLTLTRRAAGSWGLSNGSTFVATGIGGPLTGRGLEWGIVDDPVKDRLQAESPTYRKRADDYFRDVFRTRLAPGASIIVNMARWHPDDLSGVLVKRGYPYMNLKAIRRHADGSQSTLWPEQYDLKAMLELKADIGAFSFESLYQGAPRPRGGSVFGDCYLYNWLKRPARFKVAIGLDLAYSKKTSADYSVAVVMAECDGYYYVLDVIRVQQRAPQFLQMVRSLQDRYPTARTRWYASGTEEGAAQFFRDAKVSVQTLPPIGDKFVRSIKFAAKWNDHRVLVPDVGDGADVMMPWVNTYVEEHTSFTGVSDTHDDQVDASVAAFDLLAEAGPTYDGIPTNASAENDTRKPGEGGRRRM